jgi:hypothetical protein
MGEERKEMKWKMRNGRAGEDALTRKCSHRASLRGGRTSLALCRAARLQNHFLVARSSCFLAFASASSRTAAPLSHLQ